MNDKAKENPENHFVKDKICLITENASSPHNPKNERFEKFDYLVKNLKQNKKVGINYPTEFLKTVKEKNHSNNLYTQNYQDNKDNHKSNLSPKKDKRSDMYHSNNSQEKFENSSSNFSKFIKISQQSINLKLNKNN